MATIHPVVGTFRKSFKPNAEFAANQIARQCFEVGKRKSCKIIVHLVGISSSGRSRKLCKSNVTRKVSVVTKVCGAPGRGDLGPLAIRSL